MEVSKSEATCQSFWVLVVKTAVNPDFARRRLEGVAGDDVNTLHIHENLKVHLIFESYLKVIHIISNYSFYWPKSVMTDHC